MKRFAGLQQKLATFLLPEKLSLKVIFDNVRNTIIAATVMSSAIWISSYKKPPFDKIEAGSIAQEGRVLLGSLLFWIGFMLLVLNVAQIVLIYREAWKHFAFERGEGPETLLDLLVSIPASLLELLFKVGILVVLLTLQVSTIAIAWLFMFRTIGDVL